jgi:3D (Asp-Asp-Asp) domain-containing protein
MDRRRARCIAAILLAFGLAAPAPAESPQKVGRALMTFYWMIDESSSRYRGKRDAVLRDARGEVIASTYHRFKRDLVMEGTGLLRDGRTVTYNRRIDGESRFRVSKSKYGDTVTGCPLIPYRTIAADSRFVKLGSTIYIPQLKGAKLPDGTIHDGRFVASDHGHFRGAHIDVFIGAGSRGSRPFARKGYGSRSRVTVYLAGEADRHRCRP